ncbi:hypothetical protein DV711_02820 [Motiliproteus coralliicola]|uniref:Methylenetetrahydrofolate reductase n=1 Tax=Motiliproteus coralliicola TaxID=2283196 RepID=A0A369WS95_9GAMM|nr:methylenetetrahydrofolate reductase [Motiliproteus coralliicola]RDE24537.1 hypothetical protein DV711_02820 [Motiliproteus coralliicola]
MTLASHSEFGNPKQGLYLFGTTPPKGSTDDMQMNEISDKLLERLAGVDYDGLIVYDIQDESARIDKPRPFPFIGTRDPREYSALLATKSQRPIITYKSVSQRDRASFEQWLDDAWNQYGVRNLVLVGSPSADADIKLSLPEAYQAMTEHDYPFSLGGVTIAERHAVKGDEHQRLSGKVDNGCEFFVSQAVYDADATIALLRQYGELCQSQGSSPKRIVLTFTPCGSAKTLEFMSWLGISVPAEVASEILEADNPLMQSIRTCQRNLERILDACQDLDIPLGLNIESLTNRKDEIDASIRLFKLLKGTLEERLHGVTHNL